jgi:hypothetical protein
MRVRIARAAPGLLVALALTSWPDASTRAQEVIEDRVTVRAVYFREASTRVVQPMVEASRVLPDGFDVRGHALVDAITSASVAQGALTDELFTEKRYEVGVQVGRRFRDLTRVSGFLRYSNEPDYKSYTGGLAVTREIWQRTGTVGFSVAGTSDDIVPLGRDPKSLGTYYLGGSYIQVLSPTTNAQVMYELFKQNGYLANPYIAHPNLGREDLPTKRLRHAATIKAAQYIPDITTGLQLHYRFYFDQLSLTEIGPWGMTAHTVEGRLYKNLGRDFELRFDYRYHWQSAARFWCNSLPSQGGDIGCYGGTMPPHHSVDPKFGDLTTQMVQLKGTWDTRVFAGWRVLGLFAAGAFEVSYGYYFEDSPYGMLFNDRNAPPVIGNLPFTRSHGGAHLIQTGYSLPF